MLQHKPFSTNGLARLEKWRRLEDRAYHRTLFAETARDIDLFYCRGFRAAVAVRLGVARSTVTNVLRGRQRSLRVEKAIIQMWANWAGAKVAAPVEVDDAA